jgi:hypothetical protein
VKEIVPVDRMAAQAQDIDVVVDLKHAPSDGYRVVG